MEEYEALQAKLKTLLKKETSAKIRYEENNERYELAKETFAKESADVEKLQAESLSTFLKRLVGNYDKKLDKEMQEKLTAKMELDLSLALLLEAREDLAAIQTAVEQSTAQIKQLKDFLYRQDPHFREKITDEEIKRAQLNQELLELDEASAAGERALEGIDDALKDLDSADSFSTWDMFTDSSLIFDMMKYDKINKAEAKMSRLEQLLENYTKELKDLSLDTYLSYEKFSGMGKTFDIFFDNLFSDWDTKAKIGRNIDMLETLGRSIIDLQGKLKLNRQELEKQIKESETLF
ncbi:coiled-coil domain-containing protein [Carnobacterium jeotgali]|uniref:coiled-coil domain-containing protein n=1 Tax=Carnobacterium jeotgali TaxID=545534 RepID=UPI00388D52DB